MSWLTDIVRPKIKTFLRGKNKTPENLWDKCPQCEHMIFHRDLLLNDSVCHHCQHHMKMSAQDRLKLLYDHQTYHLLPIQPVMQDPLKFKDSKKYSDRLKEYRQKTQRDDAVLLATGMIHSVPVTLYVLDFAFMGGSMGQAAGQAFVDGCHYALQNKTAFIAVTSSGGARMQEGIFSLMQMARTTAALHQLKKEKLPYLTILTNPTTGGVTASFAMLGDITLAEPGATIGFAGARVVQETIRQKLPDHFQTAEFLKEHGMVDQVVHRKDLRKTVGVLLNHLMRTDLLLKD